MERNKHTEIVKEKAMKYIKYLKVVSIAVELLIIVYTLVSSASNGQSIAYLLQNDLSIVCGFIAATSSLFSWYVTCDIEKNINDFDRLFTAKFELLELIISNLLIFNYATFILGILTYKSIFSIKQKGKHKKLLEGIKEEKTVANCITIALVYIFLIVCEYLIGAILIKSL